MGTTVVLSAVVVYVVGTVAVEYTVVVRLLQISALGHSGKEISFFHAYQIVLVSVVPWAVVVIVTGSSRSISACGTCKEGPFQDFRTR